MKNSKKFNPSFVLGSSYRKQVFLEISRKGIVRPKDLFLVTKHKYRSHLSRTLRELKEEELVYCKNPEDSHCRFYELSETGKKLREELEKYIDKEE